MIAYVVACWFGDRRVPNEEYAKDRAHFVNAHIEQMSKLQANKISTIIFVLNDPKFAINVPKEIAGKEVRVLRRNNVGMSYGAWDHAYQTYKNEFDNYFFIEDDYIPTLDHFDNIFLKKMRNNTGYVCSLYMRAHSAISNGLVSTQTLKSIRGIPHPSNSNYGDNERVGQLGMSRKIEAAGWKIDHVGDDYCVPFLTHVNDVIYYGNAEAPIIIAPVCLEREKNV